MTEGGPPAAAAGGGPGRLGARHHLAVLATSFALVALFTYPLILDPGRLLPHHKDPFMYGWTMVSNVHRLLSTPLAVFHGNTFYPHGNSIAYTDLLLTPTLTAAPVYLLTGNPVLQYNLTLLLWWALSGWAMYVLVYRLLRSHAAAAVGAIVFTLCPFRTDFFAEFQMQLAFPIPLAVLGLLRFLETPRWRYLAAVVLLLWIEALASMYYAIILGLALAVLTVLHAMLRSGDWSRRTVGRALVGGLVLGLILAPFLVPYFQNRVELGMERALRQPAKHAADVLTYLETGVAKLYRFRPTAHAAETSLFMGFGALGLALVACWPTAAPSPVPAGPRRARRALTLALALAVAGFAARIAVPDGSRGVGGWIPPPQRFLDAVLLLGLLRIGLEGWVAARAGAHRGPLGERELRWICLFLIALFFDLSLGSWIHVAGREMGPGLYNYLHDWLLPLRAMRITSRIGVVVVLGVSLLAAMGTKRLLARWPDRRVRVAVAAAAGVVLLAEYHSFPLPYDVVEWDRRPEVYRAIAADPDDVAVLEWPLGIEYWDDRYTFMSIGHWKRLVNGASGFLPRMTRRISTILSRPEMPDAPFPADPALDILLGIHPLRYVVVHNDLIAEEDRRKWQRLRMVPWAQHVAAFGQADLYRLTADRAGGRIQKWFSWDYARGRRELSFRARSVGPPGAQRRIEVELNGRPVEQRPLGDDWTAVTLPLREPLFRSAPNTVTITHRYRRLEPPPGKIGTTGREVPPVDLYVASGGFPWGNRVSVLVDGVEHALNRRGYNIVAIEPATGRVAWADAFDTHQSPAESQRMADALQRLPSGTVVAAAVKDEGSIHLTAAGVEALRSVGGTLDLRGGYRDSHLVLGVKGAPPGTAEERRGARFLELVLGTPPDRTGVELRDFGLR